VASSFVLAPITFAPDPSTGSAYPATWNPVHARTRRSDIAARHPYVPRTTPAVVTTPPDPSPAWRRRTSFHRRGRWPHARSRRGRRTITGLSGDNRRHQCRPQQNCRKSDSGKFLHSCQPPWTAAVPPPWCSDRHGHLMRGCCQKRETFLACRENLSRRTGTKPAAPGVYSFRVSESTLSSAGG